MATVISLIAVISTLTAKSVSLLMQLGQSTTNAANTANAVEQLQKAFRRDVHNAATASQIMGDEPSITLQMPSKSEVVYRIVNQDVHKIATSPEGKESFEVYQFTTHQPSLKLTGDTVQVILTPLTRNDEKNKEAVVLGRKQLIITAVLGASGRHVKKPESETGSP